MRCDCNRRVDAERHRGEDRSADGRTVDEVVEGVAQQHERRCGAVDAAFVGVAMAQQYQLLEYEEDEDAGQQRSERA